MNYLGIQRNYSKYQQLSNRGNTKKHNRQEEIYKGWSCVFQVSNIPMADYPHATTPKCFLGNKQ